MKFKEISKSLKKKGFTENKTHHKYFIYGNKKKSGLYTFISHGHQSEECSNDLKRQIAQQLSLSIPQFNELINCTLDEQGYVEIVKSKGVL